MRKLIGKLACGLGFHRWSYTKWVNVVNERRKVINQHPERRICLRCNRIERLREGYDWVRIDKADL